jgi:hypothetical protein
MAILAAMDDTNDFFTIEPRIPSGKGGYRPNAGGRPKGTSQAPPELDEDGNEKLTHYQRYEKARADKETQLARQAMVKADLDENRVVERVAVQNAAAAAFAACSQALDAIGDMLEREGFAIDVCERVMELVNAAKEQLATDLEATHNIHAE